MADFRCTPPYHYELILKHLLKALQQLFTGPSRAELLLLYGCNKWITALINIKIKDDLYSTHFTLQRTKYLVVKYRGKLY